jgi:hypothetical protein
MGTVIYPISRHPHGASLKLRHGTRAWGWVKCYQLSAIISGLIGSIICYRVGSGINGLGATFWVRSSYRFSFPHLWYSLSNEVI